jgi:hypothetical protein
LFRAELMKALLRSCERLTLRNADMHPQRDAARKATDHDAADQHFPDTCGSASRHSSAARSRRTRHGDRRRNGMRARRRRPARTQNLAACPPILVSHHHPRISRRSVWLHGFGSGKRVPSQLVNVS